MIIRRNSLAAALLVTLSVAGCANGAAEVAAAPGAVSAGKGSSTGPSIQPVPDQPGKGDQTLNGKVTAGTEPGCLLLDNHLLLIDDPKLKAAVQAGTWIIVTGRADKSMATTCQQGTPFVVTGVARE